MIEAIGKIRIGSYRENPQPFYGPLVHAKAAEKVLKATAELKKVGARVLVEGAIEGDSGALISPTLVDVTGIKNIADEEVFGPLLKLYWAESLEEAICIGNDTRYGLCASLLSDDKEEFKIFYDQIRAGVINWNRPTTGSSSYGPFGGVGLSGNYRPSGYFACDYTSYAVASNMNENLSGTLSAIPAGLELRGA